MKLLTRFSNSKLKIRVFNSGISGISLYSTQTYSSSLYQRLHSCFDPQSSIIPILEKWVGEGRTIDDEELKRVTKSFRKSNRFRSALEIAEWMSDSKSIRITPGHLALRLDLISKVHGTEQAENYFNTLPETSKVLPVYSALLHCYAEANSLEKAESVMEEIRKLDSTSNIVYNTMMKLYSQTGNHEKIDYLTREMEERGVAFDEYSYNIRLNAYVDSSDIEKMEKLLMKMEVDPLLSATHHTYFVVAKGYIKSGDREKALVALKKAEHLIRGKDKRSGYIVLLTLYAKMQKKEDVYRLWKLLKFNGNLRNMDYMSMMNSLLKLNDLDGVIKLFKEWEEKNVSFDIRIPNLVIFAYCKTGHLIEAEAIVNKLVESGKSLSASTWSRLALGYYENGLMDKAVELTKKSFLSSFEGWKPDLKVVAACLEYLKSRGDTNGAEEIVRLLGMNGKFSLDFKERIERYVYNGKEKPEALEVGM